MLNLEHIVSFTIARHKIPSIVFFTEGMHDSMYTLSFKTNAARNKAFLKLVAEVGMSLEDVPAKPKRK